MYSEKKSILQLTALLLAHGVRKVVLCPGSRNAPIVHTFVQTHQFTCYQATDERSAGFQSIGLAIHDQKPVAVCCTSGSALLNLHPAVAEAYYQQVPLIVISADRPAAWINQMDGQTLPQSGVFGTLVKSAVTLPKIKTEEDEWYCNRLINEALLEVDHHGVGPIQINLPISEPLYRFPIPELPKVRVIQRIDSFRKDDSVCEELITILRQSSKRMVLSGQSTGLSEFPQKIRDFLSQNFVCFAEHLNPSSTAGHPIRNFDVALSTMDEKTQEAMAPDLLITYGGHLVSKRLKHFLRAHPPKHHWHISRDGKVVDLFQCLTTVIEEDPLCFWEKLADRLQQETPMAFLTNWQNYCSSIPVPQFPYSQMQAMGTLMEKAPVPSVIHLANSSTVRYAQLYPLRKGLQVCCNRGVNGIEGSLSAAVGYSLASRELNFVCIGDLSFFYDMNALWNGSIGPNLRILLFNNGGGEIFQTLPGIDQAQASRAFILAEHETSARGWAETRSFRYLQATDATSLDKALEDFLSPELGEHPLLLEVFTDKDADTKLLQDYLNYAKSQKEIK